MAGSLLIQNLPPTTTLATLQTQLQSTPLTLIVATASYSPAGRFLVSQLPSLEHYYSSPTGPQVKLQPPVIYLLPIDTSEELEELAIELQMDVPSFRIYTRNVLVGKSFSSSNKKVTVDCIREELQRVNDLHFNGSSCCDEVQFKGCCSEEPGSPTTNAAEAPTSCCETKNNTPCEMKTSSCCQESKYCSSERDTTITEASCCSSNNDKVITSSCCNNRTKVVPLPSSDQHNITCLAVLRPNQTTLVLFDIHGASKSFRLHQQQQQQQTNIDTNLSKLCFSSHNTGDDGMLMHCFDSKGAHGIPDTHCQCGVREPHLHAHYHSELCDDNNDKKGKNNFNWRFLSQITLHLETTAAMPHMPIHSSMPKECNSSMVKHHLQQKGMRLAPRDCCQQDTKDMMTCHHRKYPIHHEDHTDYLIHNQQTGGLHLEHPCMSCGENDIHGKFTWMHTRSWMEDSTTSCCHPSKEFRVHFFQEPQKEEHFDWMDSVLSLFDVESSRVHAVRVVDELLVEQPATASSLGAAVVGRSQFYVEKICCASETRQIQSLLRVKGVVEVMVNTTTKVAFVDHDTNTISAMEIAAILNEHKFGARVKKDCGLDIGSSSGIPTDVLVLSKFCGHELRLDEKNDRAVARDAIEACLKERFSNEEEFGSISVDVSSDVLIVEHNPYYLTAANIADALDSYGYELSIESDGGADGLWALATMQPDADDTIEHHKSTVRPTVILSGIFWFISMLSLIGGLEYLQYAALLSVVFGLPPIAIKAFATLRRFHFDVNCMMLFAVLGAVALQDFEEAAAVTFLFAISEALESKCTSRARNAIAAIICLRPEHANLINPITQDVVVLPVTAVAVGSLVRVRAGDKVPCDGIVVEGTSTIDESNLTGESKPVSKSAGMSVSGGTINTGLGQLVVKTTSTSDDSAVSRLIRLVEEAQINRSDTEKMVDRFAKIYTPFVVVAAICMATIPWALGREVGQIWLHNALVTIVIACPCALVISTPVVYVAGLTASAQRGVIVKGGQHLESLGRAKAIAFDKTGTLSQGVFQLLHFKEIGWSRKEVLALLALMEAPASHPLSDAIVKGAASEQVSIPTNLEAKNHTLLAGEGITAVVDNKCVYVGNKKLFQRVNLYDKLPRDFIATVEAWTNEGATTGFIGILGEGIIGAYCVADKIRDEAKSVIKDLKKMGIEITMLTGDMHPAAMAIGGQIGLDEGHIKSELLPEDKMSEISNKVAEQRAKDNCLKTKRSVMMVGDGVNDAPALALSDVSVAMGEGSSLALETSDITLMDSNLGKLLYVVRMGRRVIRTIFENIFISLFLKALVVGLLFAGYGSLWAAIASDVGAMLIVTLNGMKLLPYSRKVDMDHKASITAKEPEDV